MKPQSEQQAASAERKVSAASAGAASVGAARPKRFAAIGLFAFSVLAGAAVGGSYALYHKPVRATQAGAQPAPMPVSVAAAVERSVTQWDDFSGRLEAVDGVSVRSRVSGVVESVHFTAGSMVRKGDTLFMIDPKPFAAEVARAEAALAAAQARYALTSSERTRAQRLLDDRAIAQREFDERDNAHREAAAAVHGARAALDIARLNLGYTRIVAPISGRVGKAEVTAGNLIPAGASGPVLTSIVSISPIYATFQADERTFLKVATNPGARQGQRGKKGVAVRMGLAHEEGFPREGSIEFVDNQLDPRSGTIRVRAVFDNADGVLAPGLFARLRFAGAGEKKVVLVSDRAVGTDQHKKFVYVVQGDNRVAYREVKLGAVVDGLRVVEEGLAAGETIVVNGIQRVRPGTTVAPSVVAMEAKPEPTHRAGAQTGLVTVVVRS